MENNNLLPAKSKKSILNKIINIFNSIFNKKANQTQEVIQNIPNNTQVSFIEELKENTDIKRASEKETIEYIVRKIEENPEMLDKLTIKNLESVRDYYSDRIKEVEKAISGLK